MDPDPTNLSDADSDPACQNDADPCGSGSATLLVSTTLSYQQLRLGLIGLTHSWVLFNSVRCGTEGPRYCTGSYVIYKLESRKRQILLIPFLWMKKACYNVEKKQSLQDIMKDISCMTPGIHVVLF
jgi:hypothetical protein